jgi:hypothetical protein
MKTFKLALIIICFSTLAKAQLTNTKWSGTMHVPGDLPVVLDFKSDTLNLVSKQSGKVFESMIYKISGDIITVVKIEGDSPCDPGFKATMKYTLINNQLTLTVFNADCENWAGAWPDQPFKKE